MKPIVVHTKGGNTISTGALVPKISHLGLSPKALSRSIAEATTAYEGLKVKVAITVDNCIATLSVHPSTSALIINRLDPNKNLSLEACINIAKEIRHKSKAKAFVGTVKEVLGTCVSVGCTVAGKIPKAVLQEIADGVLLIEEEEDEPDVNNPNDDDTIDVGPLDINDSFFEIAEGVYE